MPRQLGSLTFMLRIKLRGEDEGLSCRRINMVLSAILKNFCVCYVKNVRQGKNRGRTQWVRPLH